MRIGYHSIEMKSFKEIENLSVLQKTEYYRALRTYCEKNVDRKPFNSFTRRIMYLLGRLLRTYEFEMRGCENIPKDDSIIFVCNHSNSHDFFTQTEAFVNLRKKVTMLAARDGLNWLSRLLFMMGNTTFITRYDNESKKKGELSLCNSLLNGISAIIFAESTWNLHPVNVMLPLKAGPIEIALITGKKVIPTIFEYVEVDHICKKESELYRKCIVSFGEPIEVKPEDGLFEQTRLLQERMGNMRCALWKELGIKKDNINDVNTDIYMNHLDIKKNKALGFKYNSSHESKFIRRIYGQYENEYFIDANGQFVPHRFY